MLDLNHGAGKPAGDVSGGPLDDRINRLVDAVFVQRNLKERDDNPRPYVGASLIGEECARSIQLNYIKERYGNLPGEPEPFPAKICRTFRAGHVFEGMAADALRDAGWGLDTGYYDEAGEFQQHGFSLFDGKLRGHFDGIVRSGPVFAEYPRLWECKALNANGVSSVLNNGLEESKPIYYAQIQINQHVTGMIEPCWMTIINKNTSEWHHILIGHEPQVGRALVDKGRMIIEETEAGRLLPRPYNDPNVYKCRQWCNWREVCWKKLP